MTSSAPASRRFDHGARVPRLYRVTQRRRESIDVVTLLLAAMDSTEMSFRPGQFNMLSAFGVGEIAISVSDAPRADSLLHHSIRDVGLVSHALCGADVGDVVGVRGPFGSDWRVPEGALGFDDDIVVVAGGVGLAPLRGAVTRLVALLGSGAGRIFILVGARDPEQILFTGDLAEWSRRGAHVDVTVDHATPEWREHVGLVTARLASAGFDPRRTRALICGPEMMMRLCAEEFVALGVDATRILVSLERNMQCGTGWCGHCQLGPLLLCRDGPVVPYGATVRDLLGQDER